MKQKGIDGRKVALWIVTLLVILSMVVIEFLYLLNPPK